MRNEPLNLRSRFSSVRLAMHLTPKIRVAISPHMYEKYIWQGLPLSICDFTLCVIEIPLCGHPAFVDMRNCLVSEDMGSASTTVFIAQRNLRAGTILLSFENNHILLCEAVED